MISNSAFLSYFLGFILTLIISLLTFLAIVKSEEIKRLRLSIRYLQNSLDQLDEQAKLIVRTDLELNKIQEELDKKISELYTLQRLSRAFASTLDEKEIFKQIKPEHIEQLGIQKALGLIWQEKEKKFLQYLTIGYNKKELDDIRLKIESNHEIFLKLIEGENTLSLRNAGDNFLSSKEIKTIFKVATFCISPILPKEGTHGFLFVGTTSQEAPITESDEELITILARSIGQALENARLFEATWRAQQELEMRVEQRTRELTEAIEELKMVSKRKSTFVSAVSHELRTPLTSIKGYASILLNKNLGEIPDAITQRLEKINRHSDELVHMINDLLDISRLESGRITMKQQPCNLKQIAEGVLDLLSVQIQDKGLQLATNIPANLTVVIDKSHIERVFINLISNAIKFTPQKGKITLSAKPVKNFVQVNISDTGIGIPAESKEIIFEEFYRIDNPTNEKVKGTGLGLSLVKNIVEAHQGSIWVEDQYPTGSSFNFLLPTENLNR